MQLKPLIRSLRPTQWIKNLVIFAGLIFSQNLGHPGMLLKSCVAFVLFCLLSSAIYLVNDVHDREQDRVHPVKKDRPVASGLLSVPAAIIFSLVLSLVSLGLSFLLDIKFGLVALAYCVLMLAYTFFIKRQVILDVFAIALGFVLRAVAGAEAIEVPISDWLLICVILLALFLALAKRRHELSSLEDKAGGHRHILAQYSDKLLDQMISVVTAATLVCYSLYTLSPETVAKFGTTGLKYTIPFVLYGLFRYLYLIYIKSTGGSPEKTLLTDRWLLADLILYVAAVWFIVYQ